MKIRNRKVEKKLTIQKQDQYKRMTLKGLVDTMKIENITALEVEH